MSLLHLTSTNLLDLVDSGLAADELIYTVHGFSSVAQTELYSDLYDAPHDDGAEIWEVPILVT